MAQSKTRQKHTGASKSKTRRILMPKGRGKLSRQEIIRAVEAVKAARTGEAADAKVNQRTTSRETRKK